MKEMALDYEKETNPEKHIRRVIKNAELHQISSFDSDCIFNDNRLRVHILVDSFNAINGISSPIISLPKKKTTIPITQITQICCSKSDSNASKWKNIYEFGKHTYESGTIKHRDNIDALIRHFMRGESELQVNHYCWNEEFLWDNFDGSHNFAITYYHAVNQGLQIDIPVQLTPYIFDVETYSNITQDYLICVTHKINLQLIIDLKWKYRFEITQFDYPMHGSSNVIFLIPSETKVAKIINSEFNQYYKPFHRLIESM